MTDQVRNIPSTNFGMISFTRFDVLGVCNIKSREITVALEIGWKTVMRRTRVISHNKMKSPFVNEFRVWTAVDVVRSRYDEILIRSFRLSNDLHDTRGFEQNTFCDYGYFIAYIEKDENIAIIFHLPNELKLETAVAAHHHFIR